MRDLAQTHVVAKAAAGAAVTAFVCHSRFVLWPDRPLEVWTLSGVVFFAAFFLWGSVFAWHEKYSGRPVVDLAFRPKAWARATVLGLSGAALMAVFLDPVLRPLTPQVYPTNLSEWVSMTLFTAAFAQLCLCFAPLAFALRLLPSAPHAAVAAVVWALSVTVLKFYGLPQPVGPLSSVAVLAARGASAAACVWFYWEGGLPLALWWTLLLELRHFAAF
ncbi:hypothetical protein EPO15_05740 [bacterium]|nr:MAG: hypothetical protein EPO15_05740 [bacterium]